MQNEFKMGYAFGLLVGEGCFTGAKGKPTVAVKLHADDPKPLALLMEVFGGVLHGPYCHQNRNYYLWQLRGIPLRKSMPIIEAHLPESRKREQYQQWVIKYQKYFDWPGYTPE
ncbi:hypothetical protein [Tellurirhabdus rosea]|uniref:hypothetical protein n=1 Tax=Tellurirhabdus rosea TaxID=2674997 RepID=UPI00225B76F7|nr:hypothetical protein [Tellurirhabdus rosea]